MLKEGIVIKSTGSNYTVEDDQKDRYTCKIKGRFRIEGHKTTNPLAVGDNVFFEMGINKNTNLITEIKPRKNYIIRKSTNLSRQYHIIAANIDQAMLVVTLKLPETSAEFIDRYLITAEAYSIPSIILFNKTDIYTPVLLDKMKQLREIYEDIGYPCLELSATRDQNLRELIKHISGKITLLGGNSGVGKTTIINRLNPEINLKVGEISEYHKTGKHTTTFAEMIPHEHDGYLIDTPGIRGFGLIDFGKEELFHFFPEIFEFSRQCKFHNCLHVNEPGCAVKEAYFNGKISEQRYNNYLKILLDDDEKYR